MTKTITIDQFLTEAEIAEAINLFTTASPGTFAATVDERIIAPNLDRINASLGQKNDSRYLAYAVEWTLMQSGKGGR
jgi:hypothetical protein